MRKRKQQPDSCNERCISCTERFRCKKRVLLGYERLAFGSTTDAFRLLMSEAELDVSLLDLYNVSEIKKPKDGAMELKFFDRLKALEYLAESSADTGEAGSLYDALNRCAANIGGESTDEN